LPANSPSSQGDSLTFLAPVTLDGIGSTVEFLGAALAKAAAGYTYDTATGKLDIFSAHGHLLADLTVHIPTTGYSLLVIEAGGGPPAPYSGLYIATHISGGVTPGGTLSEFNRRERLWPLRRSGRAQRSRCAAWGVSIAALKSMF
jgi:hypothetical protein